MQIQLKIGKDTLIALTIGKDIFSQFVFQFKKIEGGSYFKNYSLKVWWEAGQ